MKIFITTILTFILTIQSAFADTNCDWSQIKANVDGTYTYNATLNRCVGKMVKDLDAANNQIADYQKAITLKDLAIKESDDRANLWMNNSLTLENHLSTIDSEINKNKILYLGLGILITGFAVWGAGQLSRH